MKSLLRLSLVLFSLCLTSCNNEVEETNSSLTKTDEIFYHISFNSNGGTKIEDQLVKKGEKIVKPNDPIKDGYTFNYWSYQNAEYLFDVYAPTSDMTLEAHWNVNSYNVTITNNLDFGYVTGSGKYAFGSDVVLTVTPNAGYEFVGWLKNEQIVCENRIYSFDMCSHDVNLVTQYKTKKYSATIQNSDACGTVTGSGKYECQETVVLNATPKTGYRFAGWYLNNQLICETEQYSFSMPSHDVVLSTRWEKQQVTLTVLNSNSMAGSLSGNSNGLYDYGTQVTVTASPKNLYFFNGWFINNEIVSNEETYTFTLTGDTSITAKWGVPSFDLTLEGNNSNAGTITGGGTYLYGTPVTISATTNYGYKFLGWYKYSVLYTTEPTYMFNMPGESFTLVARWDLISYNITYVLNGGTNNSLNPSKYNIESSFELATPTKTGYTFLGWFDKNNSQVTSIEAGTSGALTLTAHWNEGDTYVATLDPNNGSVSQTAVDVQYNHSYTLPDATRFGYIFDGWYDGDNKVNSSGTWNIPSSKTLVAHWSFVNYEITYILGGGTNSPSNPSSYTIEDTIVFAEPTKPGYDFIGWYKDDNVITGISSGNTEPITIEARWSVKLNA